MTYHYDSDAHSARLIEECAEEIGRLESLLAVCPGSVPMMLQSWAVAALASPDAQATRVNGAALVSASVEPVHAAAPDDGLRAIQERVEAGERRARSGVPLTVPAELALPHESRARLQDALRPGGQPRSALLRAVCVAAELDSAGIDVAELEAVATDAAASARREAELLAALLLVSAGSTDRLRFLPFAEFLAGRSEAADAWRSGETQPYVIGALSALAPSARRLRVQLRLLLDARAAEDAHLDSIGRAAVTARRALQVLRDSLATSMPDLAQRLDCSRPAAGAALDRLVELGLAEEITGRGRDRVYVWAGAWGLS